MGLQDFDEHPTLPSVRLERGIVYRVQDKDLAHPRDLQGGLVGNPSIGGSEKK